MGKKGYVTALPIRANKNSGNVKNEIRIFRKTDL